MSDSLRTFGIGALPASSSWRPWTKACRFTLCSAMGARGDRGTNAGRPTPQTRPGAQGGQLAVWLHPGGGRTDALTECPGAGGTGSNSGVARKGPHPSAAGFRAKCPGAANAERGALAAPIRRQPAQSFGCCHVTGRSCDKTPTYRSTGSCQPARIQTPGGTPYALVLRIVMGRPWLDVSGHS